MKLYDIDRATPKRRIGEYRWLRSMVQAAFLTLVLWIGGQFTLFVWQLERGLEPTVSRPPGVEAFLPISALISLKYWLLTGIFNHIHPAGLVLLLVICSVSLLLKRAFCSWVCPFGLLGDVLENPQASAAAQIIAPAPPGLSSAQPEVLAPAFLPGGDFRADGPRPDRAVYRQPV